MKPRTRLSFGHVLVLALTACGPKTGGETEATSEGTGTATSEGTGTATSAGTESTTNPTTGASAACEPFLDQAIAGPEVVVTIENTRDAAVFVLPGPACTSDPLLELRDAEGDPLTFRHTVCDFTCDDLFAGDCLCAADCGLAPTIRLEPGGKYSYTWAGQLFVPVSPPLACFEMECGPACAQQQQAGAGDYSFATMVGSEVTGCADNSDLCACEPGPEGWCELYTVDQTMIGGAVPVSATFAYPAETAVALVVM